MKESPLLMPIVWDLFQKLRRRGFAIGVEDYEALQQSLRAGFGWSSQQAFLNLCTALWAKSRQEGEVLAALFEQLAPEGDRWVYSLPKQDLSRLSAQTLSPSTSPSNPISQESPQEQNTPREDPEKTKEQDNSETSQSSPKTEPQSGLPPISIKDVCISERPFVFVPQFPLTYREVAQTWRRLKRQIRKGAATELDLAATIAQRCQLGVVTNVVMRPRTSNVARLLLLVDRQGSMAPFHRFCDEVCRAITEAGRLGETAIYYFHNVPAEGADDRVLEPLVGQLFPVLDPILREIEPLQDGYVYTDRDLLMPKSLPEVLEADGRGASIVILSDAGCARKQYRVSRLLDTIACLKAIRTYSPDCVWLNPLPKQYWRNNTAGQISRHIPMFPLDREGMEQAVNVLRGHPHIIEKPI
jgi:uncharacterized protein